MKRTRDRSGEMYRIRFHGRGGQGVKTASRVLGSAFFVEGYEVQDAPRYGAERRGAPVFAYVRASKTLINERGIIRCPDLIIVVDDSLVPVPAAGVLMGALAHTVLLIHTAAGAETWKERVKYPGRVLTLPVPAGGEACPGLPLAGAACAGAAARLVGVVSRASLEQAVHDELSHLGKAVITNNLDRVLSAYDAMADGSGCVREAEPPIPGKFDAPRWVDLPFEDARLSAPAVHAAATSVEVKTGLWRTMRPVIDYERCRRCWWLCSTFCPDAVISVNAEGYPEIDYGHCKGCLVCVARCLQHAIEAVPEITAGDRSEGSK